jgi:quercetin dioxygenase-like cupin family protein
MGRKGSDDSLRCSFCHKSQDVVGKLISSPSEYPRAYICGECIAIYSAILEDNRADSNKLEELSPVVENLAQFAEFSTQKMTKTTIAEGESLFVGLNCFEPGQEHAAHAHAGQDKLYVVFQGQAEIQVGGEKKLVRPGGGAYAPSGVMHSVRNVGPQRLVVLAALAPPPSKPAK